VELAPVTLAWTSQEFPKTFPAGPSYTITLKVSESGAPTVKLASVTVPATLSTIIVPPSAAPSVNVPDMLKRIVSAFAADAHSTTEASKSKLRMEIIGRLSPKNLEFHLQIFTPQLRRGGGNRANHTTADR
jgi:hypothetical protein